MYVQPAHNISGCYKCLQRLCWLQQEEAVTIYQQWNIESIHNPTMCQALFVVYTNAGEHFQLYPCTKLHVTLNYDPQQAKAASCNIN